jgi:putative hydrolase of the HAD superfamily
LIRAVLLDALGTLVALEPPAPHLQRALPGISARDAQRAISAEIAYYRAHLDEGRDVSSLAALRRRCAEVLVDELPARSRPTDLDAVVRVLLDSLRFRAFPDARSALERLRTRGLRVVVVSNWDCSLPDVLARIGLAPLLDGVAASAAVGARKPSAAIFDRAISLAGVAPSEAIHVGDSPVDDVEGARGAGITPVLLCRDGAKGPLAVKTIASLAELESLPFGAVAGWRP